ncbi:aminotransferase class V-fold PLP-dependent enzyme [Roseivirga sp. BDSF3-8]|uniref:aminotransferase class V-fold PLP-dependent enzyme n=1 Tax=Roseivirga sp. BDSF3-8 TaxID=3241598 RepID=UPI0035319C1D
MKIPLQLIPTLRKETPGTACVTHLNNAGASLMPTPVYEAVKAYQEHELTRGGYEAAADHEAELNATYDSVARLIGAERDEIAIVENATFAWHQAFHSYPWKKGDNIVTSHTEYATNFISFLQVKKRFGIEVKVAMRGDSGAADPQQIRKLIDGKTRMIVLTHIPTNNGLVNPAEEIGDIAEEAGVMYLLDACQSVGQYPVDVKAVKCDLLSATGRKYLRAPRGTGFLYVKKSVLQTLEPMFLDLHGAEWSAANTYEVRADARRFENWETNKALTLGLKAAAEYAINIGPKGIWERIVYLGGMLREKLINEIEGVSIEDIGATQGGIVTFTIKNQPCERVKEYLQERKINVSVSHRSSTRLDMEARHLEGVMRASVHYYNNEEDLEKLTKALKAFTSS